SSKTLAHEYATILLDRLTQTKAGGWRFFDAPAWFVQGYEEYASLVLSRPRNREVVLPEYVRRQKDEQRVRFGATIEVQDPYVEGAVVMHFLHEQFGRERVQALLTAPQPTFAAALTAMLGVSASELGARWREWRPAAVTATAWIAAVRAAESDQVIAAAVV